MFQKIQQDLLDFRIMLYQFYNLIENNIKNVYINEIFRENNLNNKNIT